MIKTIIFDFGDVFINLDKPATEKELSKLSDDTIIEQKTINDLYETGKITTKEFIDHYQIEFPDASKKEIIDAWNAILLDFPEYRLHFIQNLALKNEYDLLLLSNTNELHINWVKENILFYEEFKACFTAFYLSHEIQLRKPNTDIFQFVLEKHQLNPEQTLFIDDTKENTATAAKLGIHVWNNNPKKQDITNLFAIKSDLF